MQHHNLKEEEFQVLKVDDNNDSVQMSTFIKEKLGYFENGRAFYEFTGEEFEDLDYYKEIVNVLSKKVRSIEL